MTHASYLKSAPDHAVSSGRAIDHLVFPVADIGAARSRYEQLGFTVAPDGKHPFGTENCCVFFADGTFLEPLGIAHRETCEAKAMKGHTFVRNDQAYRFRRGLEGFSHVVIKTDDAAADHKAFKKAGISGGNRVRFSRGFKTPSGEKGRVSFLLSFAADPRAPDAGFFSCEVVSPPTVDRSALQRHDNGVVGLRSIFGCEPNPTDFQYFFQEFLDQRLVDADSFSMALQTPGCEVALYTPEGLRAYFGLDGETTERGVRLRGCVLGVTRLAETRALFESNGVAFREHRGLLIVEPDVEGQGAVLAFEEVSA
ncbi:MAG: VOC family protein [Pseudomonadota bacterium]